MIYGPLLDTGQPSDSHSFSQIFKKEELMKKQSELKVHISLILGIFTVCHGPQPCWHVSVASQEWAFIA